MTKFNGRPVEILVIEDNEGDILLTQEAFKAEKIRNNIHVALDGEKAIEFLRKDSEFSDAITPDIILLDLNLPKKDGRQVLKEIKEDNNLKRIPVVIMTSSKSDQDIDKAYKLHANSYMIKPVSLEKFSEVVSAIENFWFTIVVLPDDDTSKKGSTKWN